MEILKRIILLMTVFLTIGGALSSQTRASESYTLQEQKIKAGLVYNFLKYTTWPQISQGEENAHIKICLLGGDPFDGYLTPLEGRTAQQAVINISLLTSLKDIQTCQVVFIHRSEEQGLTNLLKGFKTKNILTLSDIDGFARRGGMVEFSRETDQHIHLLINKEVLEQGGLKIEERLLKLAEVVK